MSNILPRIFIPLDQGLPQTSASTIQKEVNREVCSCSSVLLSGKLNFFFTLPSQLLHVYRTFYRACDRGCRCYRARCRLPLPVASSSSSWYASSSSERTVYVALVTNVLEEHINLWQDILGHILTSSIPLAHTHIRKRAVLRVRASCHIIRASAEVFTCTHAISSKASVHVHNVRIIY